jgi:spermidine synthase
MSKQLIETFQSKYNDTISVIQKESIITIKVDSYTQSGDQYKEIWDDVFEKLMLIDYPANILILGFGAGSIIQTLREQWPQSKITGVEIDPIMIKIARKYFPENVKGVDIVIGDAVAYISKLKDTIVYDLIVVDCYIGGDVPKTMKTLSFLHKLKKVGKHILLNQLFIPNKRSELAKIDFLRDLDKAYSVRVLKLPFNMMIEY